MNTLLTVVNAKVEILLNLLQPITMSTWVGCVFVTQAELKLNSSAREPHYTVVMFGPRQLTRVPQAMQVCERFPHRKTQLVRIQRSREHQWHDIGCRARRGGAGLSDLFQAICMMRMQLSDASVQSAKRLAVRGQHQGIFG